MTTSTSTSTATIDLTQHSLHAVLARDKKLWQRPAKWTRAHLLALGARHSRRRRRCDGEEEDSSDSEQEGDCDRGDGDEEEETYHVVLPHLDDELLASKVRRLTKVADYWGRANNIIWLLRGRPPSKLSDPEPEPQMVDGVEYRPLTARWTTPQLAVGPRIYKINTLDPGFPCLYHLLFDDKLVLPYLHSTAIHYPDHWQPPTIISSGCLRVKRRRDRIRPFEPFITAVLISRAQSSCSKRSGESNTPITTRLLFTHNNEEKYMHIYTAHISHALLDRFRHPNLSPTTPSTDPLIRLDHRRIPFEPYNTFRQRLLAAVSITTVVGSPSPSPSSRKRPLSPDGCVDTASRARLSDRPRRPLGVLDVNIEPNTASDDAAGLTGLGHSMLLASSVAPT
ncbi:hypothetical protein GGR57DRAFT_439876 [Xylariaceae sp. FL1272]|nr:hypothetical protein GGR57DRAFT_439876 [Xylariaceae sp. FL1272]